MTTTDRGRGRPRVFDEDELVARLEGFDDLALVKAALVEHSSHPTWARGCVSWLWAKRMGDPTGGVSRRSAYEYRAMLAELPFDPLRPPGGRRRVLRELAREHGSAALALVGAVAGAGVAVIAAQNPSVASWLAPLLQAADNARAVAGARERAF